MPKARVLKKLGVISSSKTGTKEINIIEWQEGYKVIDIRKWYDGDALKGISLNLMEAEKLYVLLGAAISDMKSMMNNNIENTNYGKYDIAPIQDDDLKD